METTTTPETAGRNHAETESSQVSVPEQRDRAAREERLALDRLACANRDWRARHGLAQPTV